MSEDLPTVDTEPKDPLVVLEEMVTSTSALLNATLTDERLPLISNCQELAAFLVKIPREGMQYYQVINRLLELDKEMPDVCGIMEAFFGQARMILSKDESIA